MVKIHTWNEYDPLKTVILGKVYNNDKIPDLYTGENQEIFCKINEETNIELENFELILKQNNVNVLRPEQPELVNGQKIIFKEPLINMRDFNLAYGDLFFLTYSPYDERRYNHLWLENLVNQLILDDNFIVSANEINLSLGNTNYNDVSDDLSKFVLNLFHKKIKFKNKSQINLFLEKYLKSENEYSWFIDHHINFRNKNILHTASIMKHNEICFISNFCGTEIGKKWIKKWLQKINVKPIEIKGVGHIDGGFCILNKNSILSYSNSDVINNFFENHHLVEMDFQKYNKIKQECKSEIFVPSLYYKNWQPEFEKIWKSVNGLSINPNLVLLSFYDKDLYAKLKNDGIEAIYVKWSHAKFWEGGLHCITCDIERRPE